MSVSFRSAVFNLCNKVEQMSDSIAIKKTIDNMTFILEKKDEDTNVIPRPPHGDFASISSHHRIQFLGYLLTDESVENINSQPPFHVTGLDQDERKTIELAYNTVDFFISTCLEELRNRFPKTGIFLDPYFKYKKPRLIYDKESFLTEADLQECKNSFENTKLYKKVLENDMLLILEKVDSNMLRQLAFSQQTQFDNDYDEVSKETRTFLDKLHRNTNFDSTDIMAVYSIYCHALRRSLFESAQMLYNAILGSNMLVMNNDNIIKLSGPHNNSVYEKYTTLIQGAVFDAYGGDVGSIALLVCDPSSNNHIKEFGIISSMTVSMNRELGDTSKITMVTVDDDLNPIHSMTDFIVGTTIGQSKVIYHRNNTPVMK